MPKITPKARVWLTISLVLLVASALAVYELAGRQNVSVGDIIGARSGGAGVGGQSNPVRTLTTWFWKADYWVFPVKDEAALAALHQNAARGSRAQCVACHEDKTGSKLVLHRIHLQSPLLSRLECHDCHQQVDLAMRGNTAVVTWVAVGFCKQCHSRFPGLQAGSKMRPADFESDCVRCHTGRLAPKHAQPYLPKKIAGAECKGCHGGRVLPSTLRHEQGDWVQAHGAEALASGADACYACHDFGLKFCDSCHAKKPPSHLPAEHWRSVHAAAARADTRVCYSCHKVSYCKKCHLNHETGWLQRHAGFVRQKGDSSCAECHSASACTYCHIRGSGSVDSSPTP